MGLTDFLARIGFCLGEWDWLHGGKTSKAIGPRTEALKQGAGLASVPLRQIRTLTTDTAER
jgi:hypothetical protein